MVPVHEPPPDWPAVRRTGRRGAAELSLVLQSLGLPHRVRPARGGVDLEVPPELLEVAHAELERYERENEGWPRRVDPFRPQPVGWTGPLLYALVLSLAHVLAHHRGFGELLFRVGRVSGTEVRAGEVWRALTALTLHTDITHLAGNLFLGAALGHLCAQVVGGGVAWLGILGAGGLGNLVNVYFQGPAHRSVGASTAVFGALGLLASLQWHVWGERRGGWLLRLAPFLAAGAMLGYLGTGGERTDVGAHVAGLVAGAWLGFVFRRRPRGAPGPRVQHAAGVTALCLLASAWFLALGTR